MTLCKIPLPTSLHPRIPGSRIPSPLRDLTLPLSFPRESPDAEVVSIPVPALGLVFFLYWEDWGASASPSISPQGCPEVDEDGFTVRPDVTRSILVLEWGCVCVCVIFGVSEHGVLP